MSSGSKLTRAMLKLARVEEEIKEAKVEHEAEFLDACAALFNRYGLRLDADGPEGSRLTVTELTSNLVDGKDLL